jgi:dTDP-4-amino-4,6-dideoxygalactose transaminase
MNLNSKLLQIRNSNNMIPFLNLKIQTQLTNRFSRKAEISLESGWYILGNEVKDFEKAVCCLHCHAKHCIE